MTLVHTIKGAVADLSDGETTLAEFPCGCQFWFDSKPVEGESEIGMDICAEHRR